MFPNECFAACVGFTEDQFFECDGDCNCPTVYLPVCVEVTTNGETEIIEFSTFCFAECEGYSQEDIVDCSNENECEISDLEVEIGECNTDGTYQLSINFEYQVTDQQNFDVFVRNNEFIGYYSLADLPITILILN